MVKKCPFCNRYFEDEGTYPSDFVSHVNFESGLLKLVDRIQKANVSDEQRTSLCYWIENYGINMFMTKHEPKPH